MGVRRAVVVVLGLACLHGEHVSTPSAPKLLVSPLSLTEELLRSPVRKLVNFTLVGDEWAWVSCVT